MPQQNRNTIKQWFETGDYPTQQQFWDFIESVLFPGEVGVNDINGLQGLLQNKGDKAELDSFQQGDRITFNADGFYDIPARYSLDKLIIEPTALINLKVGDTNGGQEIYPQQAVGVDGEQIVIHKYTKTGKRIYISGITATTDIIFLKRKIKNP